MAQEAAKHPDSQVREGVLSLLEIIRAENENSLSVDYSDLKNITRDSGTAILGIGKAEGENSSLAALQKVLASPFFSEEKLKKVKGALLNFSGGPGFTLFEANQTASILDEKVASGAELVFGLVLDETRNESIKVTVVVSG